MKLLPAFHPPYPTDALEPVLGEQAVSLHFGLSAGYVQRANALIRSHAKTPGEKARLEFEANGAALHRLWWENLTPPAPGSRPPRVPRRLLDLYGDSARALKREVLAAGLAIEGSGWVALVLDKVRRYVLLIEVRNHDFDWERYRPLLLIDIFEHSYLLDYGGDRKIYLEEVWRLIDWPEVERRLG